MIARSPADRTSVRRWLLRASGACLLVACRATAQLPPTTASFGGAPVVSVPFRLVHGLIVVPVAVNAQPPLQLILDSGAPVMLLRDSAAAHTLALRVVGRARVSGTGDGPTSTAPFATGITARVGALEVSGASALVGVGGDVIPGVDGVIGGALFQHAVVEVDWAAQVVRFHDPTRSRPRLTGDTLPLRVEPSLHAFVAAHVTVGSQELPVELHLDTGSRSPLMLSQATMSRWQTSPGAGLSTVVGFGSRGMARGRVVRIASLRLGRARIDTPPVSVPDQPPTTPARLGLPVLEQFDFVVDYPGQRLVIGRRRATAPALRVTTTGIVLAPGTDSSVRRVAFVVPESPAARAGLAAGDSLQVLDGTPLVALTETAVSRRLVSPDANTQLTLVVRRSGAVRTVQLRARTLLP